MNQSKWIFVHAKIWNSLFSLILILDEISTLTTSNLLKKSKNWELFVKRNTKSFTFRNQKNVKSHFSEICQSFDPFATTWLSISQEFVLWLILFFQTTWKSFGWRPTLMQQIILVIHWPPKTMTSKLKSGQLMQANWRNFEIHY